VGCGFESHSGHQKKPYWETVNRVALSAKVPPRDVADHNLDHNRFQAADVATALVDFAESKQDGAHNCVLRPRVRQHASPIRGGTVGGITPRAPEIIDMGKPAR
jgi:hypothetical protein